MNPIPILCLSAISNMYVSGLAGVTFKQLKTERNLFSVCYIILAVLILAASGAVMHSMSLLPDPGTGVVLVKKFSLVVPITFAIQITFEAVYMSFYTQISKRTVRFKKYRRNSPAVTLLIGFLEDLSYRGIILTVLMSLTDHMAAAVIICSAAYCQNHFHMIKASPLKWYFIFSRLLLGALLCVTTFQCGILWSVAVHVTYNLYVLYVVPLFAVRGGKK